jgi:hypothetical protein
MHNVDAHMYTNLSKMAALQHECSEVVLQVEASITYTMHCTKY